MSENEETVVVSLRMPKTLSKILDIQGKLNGKTKTDLLLTGASLLLSSPMLLRNTELYTKDYLRNTCHLMQLMLAQEADNAAPQAMQKGETIPTNRMV